MNDAVEKTAAGIVDLIREDRESTEALISKMQADHAVEVARLTGERDVAVARAERAEKHRDEPYKEWRDHKAELVNMHEHRRALEDQLSAAVARAERAEDALRKVVALDVQGDDESNNCEAWGMHLEEAVEIASAYFAAAKDAEPDHIGDATEMVSVSALKPGQGTECADCQHDPDTCDRAECPAWGQGPEGEE